MKKFQNKVLNLLFSAVLGLACTFLCMYAFNKLMPLIYMHLNQIEVRAELSEDYGFGMLMLFGGLGVATLLFPIFTALIYARTTRNSNLNVRKSTI